MRRVARHSLGTTLSSGRQFEQRPVCINTGLLSFWSTSCLHAEAAAPKVVRALSAPPASAADMHAYLAGIARSYNVQWTPEYRPSDVSVIFAGGWLFSDALSA